VTIRLHIARGDQILFEANTTTGQMKRSFQDLAGNLFKELEFPNGTFLMTGTGIVPPESFTLKPGDRVTVSVGNLTLENITVS